MEKRTGPSEAQLEAALQGARDMVESSRGSGFPPSHTTVARLNHEPDEPVEPDEFVKRETAVFVPGTQKKADER